MIKLYTIIIIKKINHVTFSNRLIQYGYNFIVPAGIIYPFIVGQVLYTLPASIPAIVAPVNKLIITQCNNAIPNVLNVLTCFKLSNVNKVCYGALNIVIAFHSKNEYNVVAIVKWVVNL